MNQQVCSTTQLHRQASARRNAAMFLAAVGCLTLALAGCDSAEESERLAAKNKEEWKDWMDKMALPKKLSSLPDCNKAALKAMLQASAPAEVVVTNRTVHDSWDMCEPTSEFGRHYWSAAQLRALSASAPAKN